MFGTNGGYLAPCSCTVRRVACRRCILCVWRSADPRFARPPWDPGVRGDREARVVKLLHAYRPARSVLLRGACRGMTRAHATEHQNAVILTDTYVTAQCVGPEGSCVKYSYKVFAEMRFYNNVCSQLTHSTQGQATACTGRQGDRVVIVPYRATPGQGASAVIHHRCPATSHSHTTAACPRTVSGKPPTQSVRGLLSSVVASRSNASPLVVASRFKAAADCASAKAVITP